MWVLISWNYFKNIPLCWTSPSGSSVEWVRNRDPPSTILLLNSLRMINYYRWTLSVRRSVHLRCDLSGTSLRVMRLNYRYLKWKYLSLSKHGISRFWCISSQALEPCPLIKASPILGFCWTNISSHISIIGYGGEVTTKCTLSDSMMDILFEFPKMIWCFVFINPLFTVLYRKAAVGPVRWLP